MGNLLSAEDAGFENGTVGSWIAAISTGCSIANSTAQAFAGTHSLAVTSGATGINTYSGVYPIQAGQLYAMTGSVYALTTAIAAQFLLQWWSSPTTQISNVPVNFTSVVGSWTTWTVTPQKAPPTALFGVVGMWSGTTTAGLVHYIDGLSLNFAFPGFFASVGKPGPRVSNRTGRSQGGY